MNIFKWITGRAGKVALSAMQAVGLTAVVGVAGIAAWQYLESPAETNNTFTPASYDPGEVIYVAGANTGSYASGSYAGGGESQSSMQISTNTLKRLERQEMSQRAAEEMAEYEHDYSSSVGAAPSQAYQMGGTDGLGTGANVANELDLKNNPMAAMQQSMAGVTNMISQAQQQAQQQAQAPAPGQAPAGAPALASASKNWGSSAATGGSSGNAFNSSFSVQNSGKNKGSVSAADAAKQAGDVISSAQAQAAKMMREGSSLRARASFGSGGLGDSRNASAQNSRTSKDGRDLDFIRRRSADAAKNKNRSAVEGARAFLASTKVSGGMMISADNVTTGQGQSSKDFNQDYDVSLRGIQRWSVDTGSYVDRRDKDRHDMKKWLWVALGVSVAAMIAIPILKKIKFVGFWVALACAAAATAFAAIGFTKAANYANTYGGEGASTAAMLVTPLMIGGVWTAFALGKVSKSVREAKGLTAKMNTIWGALGVGAGSAVVGASLAGSGAEVGEVEGGLQGSESDGK